MKKYLKEIIIIIIQIIILYIVPLVANNISKDAIILTLFTNIILSFVITLVLCLISKNKIMYYYPLILVVLYVPSGFIYYKQADAVLFYSIMHLVFSSIGLGIGILFIKSRL